jgi:hypothetical protein
MPMTEFITTNFISLGMARPANAKDYALEPRPAAGAVNATSFTYFHMREHFFPAVLAGAHAQQFRDVVPNRDRFFPLPVALQQRILLHGLSQNLH